MPAFDQTVVAVARTLLSRSSNELLLKTPPCKTYTTLGDRAFMASAPKLRNALPLEIRNTNTVDRFKRLLKSHYFILAFDH